MNVILYNNSSPPNKVKKSLSNSLTIENVRFTEKDSLNVVSPTIVLDFSNISGVDNDADILAKYNYCRIPKNDRYYYIDNIRCDGGLIFIDCSCDVLMSFSSDIYGSNQYVSRSQKYRNRYIVDNMLPIHSQNAYDILTFGEDVFKKDCSHVVLETTGKGGTVS